MRHIFGAVAFGVLSVVACSPSEDSAEPSTPATEPPDVSADQSSSTTTTEPSVSPDAVQPTTPWPLLSLDLEEIAVVNAPIDLTGRSGSDDLFVAERAGRIRLLAAAESGDDDAPGFVLVDEPVLDISDQVSVDGEQGLLGIEFSSDGRVIYVSYTDLGGRSVLAEYSVTRDGEIEPESARELLVVDQPYANHNGGQVKVGPDGFLYFGLGDGGGGGDPDSNGQNINTLLGSMLRIDPFPAGSAPYGIPPNNPFLRSDGAPEVFAYGLRNPWRFSFDLVDGSLWIADVGQDAVEEINYLSASGGGGLGANFGWPLVEGDQQFAGPAPDDAVAPLLSIHHGEGDCSVIGGYVYRGELIPELDGVYVFGDFCTGQLTGIQPTVDGPAVADLTVRLDGAQLWSFGQDRNGEIYVLQGDGLVAKLVPPSGGATSDL